MCRELWGRLTGSLASSPPRGRCYDYHSHYLDKEGEEVARSLMTQAQHGHLTWKALPALTSQADPAPMLDAGWSIIFLLFLNVYVFY